MTVGRPGVYDGPGEMGIAPVDSHRETAVEWCVCIGEGGSRATSWKCVAGARACPEPKNKEGAEGFHRSAEGPGGATTGPKAGADDDEGYSPKGPVEGPS